MKLNVVIPFYKAEATIEPLLMSLQDQDFRDFDVTIVVDGKHPDETMVLLDEMTKKYGVYLEVVDVNSGAAFARNYGAKISSENLMTNNEGNYLLFVDADCMIYPGMLRAMVTKLDAMPEIDFVYGDYRFDHKHEFFAQGFDPYQMETMNYVNTMSMMRRKAFELVDGFPVARKYFQDWGLFYNLVKVGCKGLYIPRFIFTTTMPTEDSISGTQGLTIAQKAAEFRQWYGIDDKQLVVTTFGAPLQAIQRAKMLKADYVGPAKDSRRTVFPVNYQFDNWKGTYMVGCFNEPFEALENHLSVMVGKKIIHFIGTDVHQLYHAHSGASILAIRDEFKSIGAKLFANSPRMVRELQEFGFDVELLYTPIYNIEQYKPTKLPEKFTVGVYFSSSNPMHMMECEDPGHPSNIPLVTDVARSMPDVKFLYFGGEMKYKPEDIEKNVPSNIEFAGRVNDDEISKIIDRCSMIVRSTIHDGFPQLPIQFMLSGRQALVSCPDEELMYAEKLSYEYPVFYEKAKAEMIDKIYAMADKKVDPVQLSENAHDYYSQLMSEETFRNKVYECL